MARIRTLQAQTGGTVMVAQLANNFIITGTPSACLQWIVTNKVTRQQIAGFSAISTTSVAYTIIK